MAELKEYIDKLFRNHIQKIVISKPKNINTPFKRITIHYIKTYYQIAKYTEKQVFHENITESQIIQRCVELVEDVFLQLNAWSSEKEIWINITKNGKVFYKERRMDNVPQYWFEEHNRRKKYILSEGEIIEPLIDMGIFTKEGKIIQSKYDKYKQINRFIEIIDDTIGQFDLTELNVIDFGCGKSYLTFIVYYYLTEIKKIKTTIIGLDLKKDVIDKCNETAKKYQYSQLHFELGDINGYICPFNVDMVITLHACDTATDFALYNAITWNAKMIFSVPCCQHELNKQIKTESLSIITRYGIIQERFSALLTDAIRGNLLEYCGYKTQLLEFVDLSHTPKNVLIRAIKRSITLDFVKNKAMLEVTKAIEEFNVMPMLYQLLSKDYIKQNSYISMGHET